jgi:hypothetical protein
MVYDAAAAVAMKSELPHRGKKGRDQVEKKKKPRWSVVLRIVRKVYPVGC